METRAHHVLIGLFTLVVAGLLMLFALWLGKYTTDKSFDVYDVVFREAVTGLSKGGIVQYNGIAVGEVRGLSLDKVDPRKVIARIRVDAETPIKLDTRAKLAIVGLTGVAQIQLSGGSPSSARLHPDPLHPVPVIVADTSAFQRLLESSEDIAATASEVLLRLNHVLRDDNLEHISNSLAHVDAVTATVFESRAELGTLIRNANAASAELKRTLASAGKAVAGVNRELVSQLPAMVAKLDRSLTHMESLTGQADGILKENRAAIRALGNEGMTQVGPALTELRTVLRDINRVVGKLERSPAGFVLGKEQAEEFEP